MDKKREKLLEILGQFENLAPEKKTEIEETIKSKTNNLDDAVQAIAVLIGENMADLQGEEEKLDEESRANRRKMLELLDDLDEQLEEEEVKLKKEVFNKENAAYDEDERKLTELEGKMGKLAQEE